MTPPRGETASAQKHVLRLGSLPGTGVAYADPTESTDAVRGLPPHLGDFMDQQTKREKSRASLSESDLLVGYAKDLLP